MPSESTAQRLLPHLRRIARAREAESSDSQLLHAFIVTRDGDAFATLVRRHGPMVLGVCRRVIGDVHLAEDAFQATFLVLARRAAAIRPRHLVGAWLYGVAYRTALKARGSAARRKAKEKQVDAMPQPAISPDEAWTDLQPVLDAELARLPDKLRIPVVLCDLAGRPQRDVARELKLPAATLANRLAAARRLLAKRLTDRGVVLSATAIASALGWHSATSAVPTQLIHSTVKAACSAAAGGAVGLPAPVLELSEGMMRMFVLKKLKAVAAGAATSLVLVAALGFSTGPTVHANPETQPAKASQKGAPKSPIAVKESDDAQFLRRLSLDLRGTIPSTLEMRYFLDDADAKKRQKVTDWMLSDHDKRPVVSRCASCHEGAERTKLEKEVYRSAIEAAELLRSYSFDSYIKRVAGDPATRAAQQEDVDKARATVEQAKVDLQAAQASLQSAEAIANKFSPKTGEEIPVWTARARIVQAEARLKVAQANLEEAEKANRDAIYKQAHGKGPTTPESITESLDARLSHFYVELNKTGEPTDREFLRRVSLDIRGVPPTKVEENYFLADKDPKKRAKLLKYIVGDSKTVSARWQAIESLLADPQVQSRWAELWKNRIAAEQQQERDRAELATWINQKATDPLQRLLIELVRQNKPDDQILDALCLATMARYPTGTEKRVILEGLKSQTSRRAAWEKLLQALAATDEARSQAAALAQRAGK